MGNQSPGSEQRPKTPNTQGTSSPGSKERDKSGQGQMDQSGRQDQTGGSQRQDRQHDSDPGVYEDKEKS